VADLTNSSDQKEKPSENSVMGLVAQLYEQRENMPMQAEENEEESGDK